MANWHIEKFGNVLDSVSRPIKVEPGETYRTLGMQWYAKGLFVREEKSGQEIRAKELYRVELGDLVYNRLFAWKGSFGIVEDDTAGGFVSAEFPCFRVDTTQAEPKYLHLFLSQEKIWEEIGRNSIGQTNISRLRLKEPDFLVMEIPLPPMDEQRRILTRIEALASRVRETRSLIHAAEAEIKHMLLSAFYRISADVRILPMSDVAPIVRRPVLVNISNDYPELGVRSFGKGTFHKPNLSGANVGNKRLYEMKPGDLVFNSLPDTFLLPKVKRDRNWEGFVQ